MKLKLPSNNRTRLAVKNIAVSATLKGCSILVSFFLVPLTLGYLNSYEYGIWLTLSSVLAWIYIFDIGIGNGLRNKLTEALAKDNYEEGKIYVSTAFAALGLLVIGFYAIYLIVSPLLNWYGILNVETSIVPHLDQIVAIVFLFICVGFVFRLVGIIFQAHQLPAFNDLFNFIGSLFSLLIIFILTKTTTGSLSKVAYTYSGVPVLVYMISVPFTFWKFRKVAPSFRYVKFSYFKGLTSLGLKFMIIQIAALVLYMTSNIIISNRFGPEEVTPYNIAYKYFNIITMGFAILLSPFWSAVTDAITRDDYEWVRITVKRLLWIWLAAAAFAILMLMFSGVFYQFWIGDKVTVSFSLSFWCMIYVVSTSFIQVFVNVINGFGRVKIQLYIGVFQAIIYIPLALWFGKLWGVSGIISALSIVCGIGILWAPLQCYMLTNRIAKGIWNK